MSDPCVHLFDDAADVRGDDNEATSVCCGKRWIHIPSQKLWTVNPERATCRGMSEEPSPTAADVMSADAELDATFFSRHRELRAQQKIYGPVAEQLPLLVTGEMKRTAIVEAFIEFVKVGGTAEQLREISEAIAKGIPVLAARKCGAQADVVIGTQHHLVFCERMSHTTAAPLNDPENEHRSPALPGYMFVWWPGQGVRLEQR